MTIKGKTDLTWEISAYFGHIHLFQSGLLHDQQVDFYSLLFPWGAEAQPDSPWSSPWAAGRVSVLALEASFPSPSLIWISAGLLLPYIITPLFWLLWTLCRFFTPLLTIFSQRCVHHRWPWPAEGLSWSWHPFLYQPPTAAMPVDPSTKTLPHKPNMKAWGYNHHRWSWPCIFLLRIESLFALIITSPWILWWNTCNYLLSTE